MANEILKTTSPICVSIAIAFLEFLSSVEGSTSSESESNNLENLKSALKDIFRISDSYMTEMRSQKPPISLLQLFKDLHVEANPSHTSSSSQGPVRNINEWDAAHWIHEFYAKLEASRFFHFIYGENYDARKTRADNIFKEALQVMAEAELGTQAFNLANLANVLHTLGRRAYNWRLYYKSVELFSCAIALFNDNAEYFYDRGRALMKIERYQEAIDDCFRALKLKPSYVEAYLAIGCIYLEQGKTIDAVCHGFLKVLQRDTNNADGLQKLQFAMFKLKHQCDWINHEVACYRRFKFIPLSSYQHSEYPKQEMVLRFRAVPPEDEGGAWKLVEVEDETTANNGGTVADFVDLLGRYRFPMD